MCNHETKHLGEPIMAKTGCLGRRINIGPVESIERRLSAPEQRVWNLKEGSGTHQNSVAAMTCFPKPRAGQAAAEPARPNYESGGQEFESLRARHNPSKMLDKIEC